MNLNGNGNTKTVCLKHYKNLMRSQTHTHTVERRCKQKEMACISCCSVLNQEAFIAVNLS